MRTYMKKRREEMQKRVPVAVEKTCIKCGVKFYVSGQGKGKSKYCFDCKCS